MNNTIKNNPLKRAVFDWNLKNNYSKQNKFTQKFLKTLKDH